MLGLDSGGSATARDNLTSVPYSATTYRLLISAPSDVPAEDIDAVQEATNRWNVIYGPPFGAVVVPMHWKQHSAAKHGNRPQSALNEQLVEKADIVVALFWHRFGSPTGESDSGTLEEIQEAHTRGAYVAILRCARDVPQTADLDQQAKLRAFYESVAPNSLMLDYRDPSELARHIDSILSQAVGRDGALAQRAATATRTPADVWPRIESSEELKTDSKGRVKASRRWRLVLSNTGQEPALNVRYRLEPEGDDGELPPVLDDVRTLEVLAPGGEASYTLVMHMGVASQARCIVTWDDAEGEHDNQATLRFF